MQLTYKEKSYFGSQFVSGIPSHALAAFFMRPQAEAQIGAALTSMTSNKMSTYKHIFMYLNYCWDE